MTSPYTYRPWGNASILSEDSLLPYDCPSPSGVTEQSVVPSLLVMKVEKVSATNIMARSSPPIAIGLGPHETNRIGATIKLTRFLIFNFIMFLLRNPDSVVMFQHKSYQVLLFLQHAQVPP